MIDPDCIPASMPVSFGVVTLCAWMAVVGLAVLVRGRPFGTFAGIIVRTAFADRGGIGPMFQPIWPLFVALHITVYLNFCCCFVRRCDRGRFVCSSTGRVRFWGERCSAMPWAVVRALRFYTVGRGDPHGLAVISFCSHATFPERTGSGGRGRKFSTRCPTTPPARFDKTVRCELSVITDPHLGPFMSVGKLRRIAEDAVKRNPDLVLPDRKDF